MKKNERVNDVKRIKPIEKDPRVSRCVEVDYKVNNKTPKGMTRTMAIKTLRGMRK